jgi:hypothetical protein
MLRLPPLVLFCAAGAAAAQEAQPTLNGLPETQTTPSGSLDFRYDPIDSWNPGEGPDATLAELDRIEKSRRGMFDPGPLGVPFDAADKLFGAIEDWIGLRFGVAYTMLFQQASGGPGDRYGGSGDLDLMSSWTLLGRGTESEGRLIFTGEYRFAIGDQPASALGGELGILTNTTGGFNDRGWVVRDAFWLQNLFDGGLRVLIGRFDPSDYLGTNPLQGINTSFSNRAFSANASIAFAAGHALGAGLSIRPTDLWYVSAGAVNGYGQSNRIEVDSLFDEWDLFWIGEAGFTPMIEGIGRSRFAVTLWRMDARSELDLPSDEGISLIAQQSFGESVTAFVRYSYADATLANVREQISGAIGINGLLGDPANLTGLGLSWADPRSGGRDEKVIECFQRFQLTRFSQLSVGVQGIFDPAYDPDSDALAVFTARFRIAF